MNIVKLIDTVAGSRPRHIREVSPWELFFMAQL